MTKLTTAFHWFNGLMAICLVAVIVLFPFFILWLWVEGLRGWLS